MKTRVYVNSGIAKDFDSNISVGAALLGRGNRTPLRYVVYPLPLFDAVHDFKPKQPRFGPSRIPTDAASFAPVRILSAAKHPTVRFTSEP